MIASDNDKGFEGWLPLFSVLLAGCGIGLAVLMYGVKKVSAERIGDAFQPIYKVFYRKYWMDELYEKVFVENTLYKGLFRFFAWFDSKIVDGIANLIGDTTTWAGRNIRKVQSGQLQAYALAIVLGILVILACFHIFG